MILRNFLFKTNQRQQLIRIDRYITNWLEETGFMNGLCVLFIQHSTAAFCITNKKDPATAMDVIAEIDRIVPTRVDFFHHMDTPRDAAGHVKTAIVGVEVICPVVNGKLVLGGAQGIFFCEFDGPRKRKFSAYLIEQPISDISDEQIVIAASD